MKRDQGATLRLVARTAALAAFGVALGVAVGTAFVSFATPSSASRSALDSMPAEITGDATGRVDEAPAWAVAAALRRPSPPPAVDTAAATAKLREWKSKFLPGAKVYYLAYAEFKLERRPLTLAVRQAKATNLFDDVLGATQFNISEAYLQKHGPLFDDRKGRGFGMWRPYMVRDMFERIADGDYLFVVNANIILDPARVDDVQRLLMSLATDETKCGSIAFPMVPQKKYREYRFTKKAVFEYFNLPLASEQGGRAQFSADVLVFRKTAASTALVNEWYKITDEEPRLVDNSFDKEKEIPGLQGNTDTQSVLSVLRKVRPQSTLEWEMPMSNGQVNSRASTVSCFAPNTFA
jgi:hypothetical protein